MSRRSHPPSQRLLQVGEQSIPYTLTFSNRKSIGITIRPDLRVEVRAPLGSRQESIEEVMQKRARWIVRHLQKFAQGNPRQRPSAKPKDGLYLFLGRQLPLQIISHAESPLNRRSVREGVNCEDDILSVWLKDRQNTQRLATLLDRWSREQAALIFRKRIDELLCLFQGIIQQPPELVIRRMRARWGSCSSNGSITLNLNLIHLDLELIDYVIVHELCHLIEHNHSSRFYALLTRRMPDWKERRRRLNELGMPE